MERRLSKSHTAERGSESIYHFRLMDGEVREKKEQNLHPIKTIEECNGKKVTISLEFHLYRVLQGKSQYAKCQRVFNSPLSLGLCVRVCG